MKSILIVDDNLASLKQISARLAQVYEVSLAKSGELALQICARKKPDLILLDVEMPGMDGFATIAELKNDPRLMHIPVIFLTANQDAATEIRGLESGAMDFITKPVNTEILRHRINLHLDFSAYQLHLEHMVHELEDNISISFAELLGCKDHNMASHVLRTGEYAVLLARELMAEGKFSDEINDEYINMMARAAPLHDVGKIGVSDLILLKRSSLTEEENLEVQKHPSIGAQVLKVIYRRTPNQHFLKMAIIIAEGHHENFDGSGYPHGRKGAEIPLCCRIMAVANVYDSCITDRAYRLGLSHEQACDIIQKGRGTEFDPQVVDAFNKISDSFPEIINATSANFHNLGDLETELLQ